MTAKLKDIAQYSGVSISTVSRVINNSGRISDSTRKRVLEAIKKFDYHPNEVARNLKFNNTKTVGVIVVDIANSFFINVIKGLESVLKLHDYNILLCNSDENENTERKYLELLLGKRISGLVLATVSDNVDYIKWYEDAGIPIVFIDNLPNYDGDIDCVVINNQKAAYEIVQYLINIGHREIGIISGPIKETTGRETFEGWKNALEDNKIPIDDSIVWHGDFKRDSGYKIMKKAIDSGRIPKACFIANNEMAYGAAKAIFEAGLKIPEDIAIVTFYAYDETDLMKVKFTTVVEPAEEIGELAASLILRRISNPEIHVHEKVVLKYNIIIGDSTCNIANTNKIP